MRKVTVTPGVVRNVGEIVRTAERYRTLFRDHPCPEAVRARPADWNPLNPHRDSEYEDDDRYHVLQGPHMPPDLRLAILRGITAPGDDLGRFYLQINRYDTGDYLLPHRDNHEQGLYMLSDSPVDGLVVQSGPDHIEFVPDTAGALVEQDPGAWHWVDPVRAPVRYTLVTIPARPPARAGEP